MTLPVCSRRTIRLQRVLWLSGSTAVHHGSQPDIGEIPGYATHYEKVAKAARYAKRVGYVGLLLDGSLSVQRVQEACTSGSNQQCERVAFREGPRFVGSAAIGWYGGAAGASLCGFLGIAGWGVGGVACAVILGGVGAAAGGYAGGSSAEYAGNVARKLIRTPPE